MELKLKWKIICVSFAIQIEGKMVIEKQFFVNGQRLPEVRSAET